MVRSLVLSFVTRLLQFQTLAIPKNFLCWHYSSEVINPHTSFCQITECLAFAEESTSDGGLNGAFSPDDEYMEMKGIRLTGTPLYLDMQATTPVDPRVLDSMLPHMVDRYGNPHSRTHALGWEAEDAIEVARKQV